MNKLDKKKINYTNIYYTNRIHYLELFRILENNNTEEFFVLIAI